VCPTAFTTSDIMSPIPIHYIFHVTNEKICAKIMEEKSFELYKANDFNYDGDLTAEDAPLVIFFTGSHFRGNLPTISKYPRCPGCSGKEKVGRILVETSYIIKRINDYNVYKIRDHKKNNNDYTQSLYFFVLKKETELINWCLDKEFEAIDITKSNSFIFVSNSQFYCRDMTDEKYVINIAFSEKFENAFTSGLITSDDVKHKCNS